MDDPVEPSKLLTDIQDYMATFSGEPGPSEPQSSKQSTTRTADEVLDRLPIGLFQLLCLPNLLKLVPVQVDTFLHAVYNEQESITFLNSYFLDYLHFFSLIMYQLKSIEVCLKNKTAIPNKNINKTIDVNSLTIIIQNQTFELKICSELQAYTFDKKTTVTFVTSFCQLALPTYCFHNSILYVLERYIEMAPTELIKNPKTNECFALFQQIDHFPCCCYYILRLTKRHAMLFHYLKMFRCIQ